MKSVEEGGRFGVLAVTDIFHEVSSPMEHTSSSVVAHNDGLPAHEARYPLSITGPCGDAWPALPSSSHDGHPGQKETETYTE